MNSQENHCDRAPVVWLSRLGAERHRLVTVVLVTIAAWVALTLIYCHLWVNNVLATETLYGYERSRLLISSAFIAYKLPYLLAALAVTIVLEMLIALYLTTRGRAS